MGSRPDSSLPGHAPSPSPCSLSCWSNGRTAGLTSGKPGRDLCLTTARRVPFTSLSPSLLSGYYPLSHKMEWSLEEQEANCNGPM